MVESILEYLAGGDSIEDILEEFDDLEKEDILASIAYAANSLKFKDIQFPAAWISLIREYSNWRIISAEMQLPSYPY